MIASRTHCRAGRPCQPATVDELIAHVAQHVAEGGVVGLAQRIFARVTETRGVPTFIRWFQKVCCPTARAASRLPADLVAPFCLAADNFDVLIWIAREAGGVFVPLPSATSAHADVLHAQLVVVKELGDQARALSGMLSDGRIDAIEIGPFEREVDEAVTALLALKPIVRAHVARERVPA